MTMVMVFDTTFTNILVISWRRDILMKKNGIFGENHQPAASHWQNLLHNVVSSTPCNKQNSNSQH